LLVLLRSSRARRLSRRWQTDQAAQVLVIEPFGDERGIDERPLLAAIEREVSGHVAVADLAGEFLERPHLAVMLEPPAQSIGRRPRKRHRDNGIELRQIASLQRERAV